MCLVLPSAAGEPWGPGSGASPLVVFHLPGREAVTLVVNRPFQAELGTGVLKQGGSRHHTLEPLLMVLSLAAEEGTSLSFPGHASTDFQRRSRTELSLARRHFWDAGSSLLPPSRAAEHLQLWCTLPPAGSPHWSAQAAGCQVPRLWVLSPPCPWTWSPERPGQAAGQEGAAEERRWTEGGPWI